MCVEDFSVQAIMLHKSAQIRSLNSTIQVEHEIIVEGARIILEELDEQGRK